MENIQTSVELHLNNTTLVVSVRGNLKKQKKNLKNFGHICIHDGSLDTKDVFWDNLSYFFEIDGEKRESIKKELKESAQYYKGVVKDIKRLIGRAKKLDLIWTGE